MSALGAHSTPPARGAHYWGRPPARQPVHDCHDARDPLKSYLWAMTNPYGVVLDDASLRWAAAESVPETVIAAICLLETRSVDEIVARLTPAELQQVIKIVGRSREAMRRSVRCPQGGTAQANDAAESIPRSHASLAIEFPVYFALHA